MCCMWYVTSLGKCCATLSWNAIDWCVEQLRHLHFNAKIGRKILYIFRESWASSPAAKKPHERNSTYRWEGVSQDSWLVLPLVALPFSRNTHSANPYLRIKGGDKRECLNVSRTAFALNLKHSVYIPLPEFPMVWEHLWLYVLMQTDLAVRRRASWYPHLSASAWMDPYFIDCHPSEKYGRWLKIDL